MAVRRIAIILLLSALAGAAAAHAQDATDTTTTATTPAVTTPTATTPTTTDASPPVAAVPAPTDSAPAKSPSLSLSISAAPSFADLAPGNTSTVTAPLAVDAQGVAWSLHVAPADPGADRPGHLRAADSPDCARGERWLRSPLHLHTTGGSSSTTVDLPSYDLGSASDPQIAHGSSSDVLSVTYRQAIAADEPLQAGCAYSVGVTWTVVAG